MNQISSGLLDDNGLRGQVYPTCGHILHWYLRPVPLVACELLDILEALMGCGITTEDITLLLLLLLLLLLALEPAGAGGEEELLELERGPLLE